MSSGRINRAGLYDARPDAQAFLSDAEYVKRGAEFSSLTGIAMTHLGNGDIFYGVSTGASAVTVTLPTVADTVGQHHIVKKIDSGAGTVNIVAAEGTAILDGSATHSIAAQYGVRCYFSDGDAWRQTNRSPSGLTLIEDSGVLSSVASYTKDFADNTYSFLRIEFDLLPATNAVNSLLLLRAGGSDLTTGLYGTQYKGASNATDQITENLSANNHQITGFNTETNSATDGGCGGAVEVAGLLSGRHKHVHSRAGYYNGSHMNLNWFYSKVATTSNITGVKFLYSSGNIAAGRVRVYGG